MSDPTIDPGTAVGIATGGTAFTAALALAVRALWNKSERNDTDARAMRDAALAGWQEQQRINDRQTDAIEKLTATVARLTNAVDKLMREKR